MEYNCNRDVIVIKHKYSKYRYEQFQQKKRSFRCEEKSAKKKIASLGKMSQIRDDYLRHPT